MHKTVSNCNCAGTITDKVSH